MDQLQVEGIRSAGGFVTDQFPDEPSGLAGLLDRARAGDVIAMMVHQDLPTCVALLGERGAVADGPADIAAKAAGASQSG
jgi:hypothetical protein